MTGDVYCGNWQEGAITGGGFNLPTPTIQVAWSNAPAGWGYLNGWLAYTKNTVAGSDSAKLYGLCAKINTEDIVNNTTPSTSGFINTYLRGGYIGSVIEPNSTSATVTHCQDGEEITGGGFGALAFTEDSSEVKPIRDYSEPDIRFYKSYPSGNGWAVEAKSNHQAFTTELWAFAVCAKVITSLSLNGSVTVSGTERIESNPRYVPLTVSPNSQNSVVSSCQDGEAVTAGGWYSQSSDVYVYKSYPLGNGWIVEAQNLSPTDARSLSVYAICARIIPIAQQMIPGTMLLSQQHPPSNDTGTRMATPTSNDTGAAALSSSATEPPLMAEAIANATDAVAPATIKLDANITGGAPPYSYSWSVPDIGAIDQDRSITQKFFEPGTFTYTLTATDSRGKTVTDNVQIVISERRLPQGGGGVAPEPGGIAP